MHNWDVPRLLVACEFSGTVRDAFIRKGWDAVSCDLLPTDAPGPHIQGDALEILSEGWDMMIAHPPCTHLAASGAAWFHKKEREQSEGLAFVRALMDAPIPRIALENPVGVISSAIRPPTQIVQPYWFGHRDMKTTCLWLKGLPRLTPTRIVEPEYVTLKDGSLYPKWSFDTFRLPAKDRWRERSKTFLGIAEAMADQWSGWPDCMPPLPLFSSEDECERD